MLRVQGMSQPQYRLEETQLEERDGRTWVSGLCPACWQRYAFPAPPRGQSVLVRCPEGHWLRIVDQTSAGKAAEAGRAQQALPRQST
jgi:hypothetical protein